ncbi:MAG: AAA family ATPase [Thermoleophilia bacterium]|nr:AAA family ATPase [Thermoleophilia bacterium]
MAMVDNDSEPQATIGLEDYLRIAWERAWIIILAILVVVGIALYVSLTTTPMYSSAASLVYQKNDMDTVVSGYGLYNYDYDRDRTIATAVAAIGSSQTLAEAVKAQLASPDPADKYLGMVSAGATEGSDVVSVQAVSTDPREAAVVANAYADQFIIFRQNADRATVAAARDVVKQQLDALTADELEGGYGLLLQDKYETLRILESMQDGRFSLLRRASVPNDPYTPQTTRNAVLALVVGLVLGAGIAILIEYLDKRVKDEKTLERVTGLPVLASVPAVGGKWRESREGQRSNSVVGFEGSSSILLESFRTLRSSLQYFDVNGTLSTIIVTSGLPREGKSVTTVNLAVSLALSGHRVVILEADLRRPMMHQYLSLDNQAGLSSVLAGKASIAKASQLVQMDVLVPAKERMEQGEGGSLSLRKNLYCLPSGPLPPNPAELLGSARMGQIIHELKRTCDYLLIDTPPILPVSDALLIAPHADAVLLAARLHASTRGELEEVRSLLDRAGVRAIGVVAGGVKKKHSYYKRGYGYGYGYGYH